MKNLTKKNTKYVKITIIIVYNIQKNLYIRIGIRKHMYNLLDRRVNKVILYLKKKAPKRALIVELFVN